MKTAKSRLLQGTPRASLLFPTPPIIHELPRLSQTLDADGRTKIWIAREDCNSGLAFGGNKVRKLEFVVQDALDKGADTLVTTGGVQSNHMRQTAAVASKLGMKTVLVPKDMVDPEDDASSYFSAGNVQLNSLMDAETLPIGTTQEDAMAIVEARGRTPYWIPAGCSQHPYGGYGYARWAYQLAKWEDENNVHFDAIVTPCGGGSTLAGMLVGNAMVGRQRTMVGVSVFAKSADEMEETVSDIADTAARKLGMPRDAISRKDFTVDVRHHAGAYGKYNEKIADAIKLVARTEGLILDPVYTGKTMAGVIDLVQNGELKEVKADNVLFVHTGGATAISAYPSLR